MANQKKYTAKEMRDAAEYTPFYVGNDCANRTQRLMRNMLRQAADTEEELQTMRCTWMTPETSKALFDDCVWKTQEIYKLKTKLAAVVKECEKWKWADDNWCTSVKDATDTHNKCVDRILRVARGEGSANT